MKGKWKYKWVVLAFTSVALVFSACGPATTTPTATAPATEVSGTNEATNVSPTFDWKKYDGESIKVYVADTGQLAYIQDKLSSFEDLTGIKVTIEASDVTGVRSNLPVKLTAQSSDFDVMATFTSVDGLQFSSNGWYEPLDQYIYDTRMTNPDFDFADFPEGARNSMKVGDETVTILWEMQTDLIYYRKDLLEKAGLAVPTTFDGWLEAIKAVHNPDEVYGVALRGNGYQITTPYSAFLEAYCGTWVKDGKADINSPEAMKAWEMYGEWAKYGPPGIVTFDWQVPAQQFAQGKIFVFLDINLFTPTLEDPAQSTVAGKVGFAPVPEGPCGQKPFIGGWGYSINPFSKNKGAAWYFIQWATSKSLNEEMKIAGWPSPRASAWNSEEFKAKDKTPEFTATVLKSLEIASAQMNPPIAPGKQAREIAGVVGTAAMEGKRGDELQTIADAQNAELQKLLDAMK